MPMKTCKTYIVEKTFSDLYFSKGTHRFTSWISCQETTGTPKDSFIFRPGILPGSCKIMEDYPENPGFLPGNSGIQETYQEIQG